MARRCTRVALLAALAVSLCSSSAFAHAGNPHYESLVEGVSPTISGFSVTVLNGDDRLEVVNHSSKTITIDGYNKEPYLRMEPGGTVSVNIKSPAYYLNVDPTDTAPVPAIADPKAPPQWKVVERDGRYQFHDHRIHWMATSTPAAGHRQIQAHEGRRLAGSAARGRLGWRDQRHPVLARVRAAAHRPARSSVSRSSCCSAARPSCSCGAAAIKARTARTARVTAAARRGAAPPIATNRPSP